MFDWRFLARLWQWMRSCIRQSRWRHSLILYQCPTNFHNSFSHTASTFAFFSFHFASSSSLKWKWNRERKTKSWAKINSCPSLLYVRCTPHPHKVWIILCGNWITEDHCIRHANLEFVLHDHSLSRYSQRYQLSSLVVYNVVFAWHRWPNTYDTQMLPWPRGHSQFQKMIKYDMGWT